MKKKRIVIFIVVILLLLLFLGYLYKFSGREKSVDGPSADSSVADTEIEILEYRESIETTCDRITIKISLTNVGENTLQYSDITGGAYEFSVVVQNIVAWSSQRGMQVSDFGTLQVGETKEVIFTGGEDYDYLGSMYHENDFRGPSGENGTFQMKVSFNEPGEENRYTVRGESESVDLSINIYEDPSQNLLKSCEGVR